MNEPSLPEESLLLQALEIDSADDQSAFLDRACGGDVELKRSVEALLRHHREGSGFLESPPTEVLVAAEQLTAGEPPSPALDFLSPSTDAHSLGRLGQYEILEILGSGGFGVVLKARDTKLDRIVAIKTLAQALASSATARQRFVREAKAAAAVKHENVVGIYHVSDEGPVPYLVMECVSGVSLEGKLRQDGTLDLPAILRIGMQIASGLAAAHKQGLVHRDVKPGNILLENGVERVKITDFGLARAADDAAITKTGEVAGTPQYMSPEQAQGLSLDARSDLFSLGSVLYAMSTGRSPFRAESTIAALRRVCDDTPRPIREINADIPDWLADIINRLLAKQPSERFQTATEVADLLGLHLAAVQQSAIVPSPKPTTVSPRHRSAIGARWWSVALIALVAVACIMGLTEASGVTKVVPTVIRVVRGEGTLVIEVDDPTVQVALDGEELSIRGADLKELKLVPGKYRLQAKKDGQPVKDELVTITRDGRKVVTVTLEGSGSPDSPSVVPTVEPPVGDLKLLAKLDGHSDLVRSVAFLPDGRRFVSVGRDKMVRIWDLATRSILSTLPVEGYLRDADVSSDGRFVAVAFSVNGKDGVVHVWDLEKQARVGELIKNDYRIDRIRISPDGTHLATGGHPSGGVLWNLGSGKEVRRYDVDDTSTTLALEYSDDGQNLAIGAVGRVRLFNSETGVALGDAQLPQPRAVLSLAFAPDGKSLTCGQMGGHISMIDVQRCKLKTSLPHGATSAHVHSLRYLDDRRLLATCYDGTLLLWDFERMKLVAKAATEQGTTKELSVSPDGQYAITAEGEVWDDQSRSSQPNGDYALRLWQLPESVWPKEPEPSPEELTLLAKLDGHTDVVRTVAFSADGRRIFSVGRDEIMRIWDVETRSITSTLTVEGYLRDADVSADGRFIAGISNVGAKKGVAQVWDIEKQKLLCELVQDLNWTNCIRFSPDGTRVVTSGDPTYGVLWDLATGKVLRRFDVGKTPQTMAAAFSPNGRLLALGAVGRVRLFDPDSGDIVRDVSLPNNRLVQDVAFTPDGETFATGQNGGAVSLIEVGSGQVIKTLQGSDAAVLSVRFLHNDQFLLTASEEGTLRVWDIQQGKVVATAATEKGTNGEVFVSPDGRYAVTASGEEWDDESNRGKANGDYALRLWQLPESVWPKQETVATSTAELPTVNREPGPFVLLAAGEERKFETLGEAVSSAKSGDTIEVRGNGPFLTDTIRLWQPLILRAGHGFRPVIRLTPATALANEPLIHTSSNLVLEGMVLERIGDNKARVVWPSILDASDRASLFVANCRFVTNFGRCFQVGKTGTLRNCEFLTPDKGYTCTWAATAHGQGVIDNCISSGRIANFDPRALGMPSAKVRLSRNTTLDNVHLDVRDVVGLMHDEVPLQIDASSNVFGHYVLFLHQKSGQSPAANEIEAIVPRFLQWNETQNVYPQDAEFFTWSTAQYKPLSTIDALSQWNDWWQHQDAASVQGVIRFAGGDLKAKATINLDQLTAADFRLHPDSIGYRAGPDGKDLGADVDLVGPGPAYERWKMLPEYQEWLKETGQKKSEGSGVKDQESERNTPTQADPGPLTPDP